MRNALTIRTQSALSFSAINRSLANGKECTEENDFVFFKRGTLPRLRHDNQSKKLRFVLLGTGAQLHPAIDAFKRTIRSAAAIRTSPRLNEWVWSRSEKKEKLPQNENQNTAQRWLKSKIYGASFQKEFSFNHFLFTMILIYADGNKYLESWKCRLQWIEWAIRLNCEMIATQAFTNTSQNKTSCSKTQKNMVIQEPHYGGGQVTFTHLSVFCLFLSFHKFFHGTH